MQDDCEGIELWRNPLDWVPKVQALCETLRQKDKDNFETFDLYRLFALRAVCFFVIGSSYNAAYLIFYLGGEESECFRRKSNRN